MQLATSGNPNSLLVGEFFVRTCLRLLNDEVTIADFEAQRSQSTEQPILPLSVVRSNRVPVEVSLAGSAWWRRQETTAETREKAAIPPV